MEEVKPQFKVLHNFLRGAGEGLNKLKRMESQTFGGGMYMGDYKEYEEFLFAYLSVFELLAL